MYRPFINESLTEEELKNFSDISDMKYCNFLCQETRPIKDFNIDEEICKKCNTVFMKAFKLVKDTIITVKEFVVASMDLSQSKRITSFTDKAGVVA